MKLFNEKLEKRALYSICESKSKYKNKLAAVLGDEHFYSPVTVEAVKRIKNVMRKDGEIPDWNDICSDPTLSEETRKSLSKYEGKPVESNKEMFKTVEGLMKFYQMRKLYFTSEKINQALLKERVDVDDLLDKVSNDITKARAKSDLNQPIFHMGKGKNSNSVVKKLLNDDKPDFIPTGIKAHDDVNGGIYNGSLFVLAGSTSGGKSALALQLALNFTRAAESVAYVPLEMTEEESMARILANISQVDMQKILQKKLAKGEKKKITQAYKKYNRAIEKTGNRFTIFSPEEDMTAEEILLMLKPYRHKVVIIDYMTLLKGVDGDDAWQQLGKIARFCKIYAKNNNMIIVLLAQVNNEGEIRYSKAVREHANNFWAWVATEETREAGVLHINQQKARNQKLFDFTIAFDVDTMTFRDVDSDYSGPSSAKDYDENELDDISETEERDKKKPSNKKKHSGGYSNKGDSNPRYKKSSGGSKGKSRYAS